MQCPHCQQHFTGIENDSFLGSDNDGYWWVSNVRCANSECNRWVITLLNATASPHRVSQLGSILDRNQIHTATLIHPKVPNRQPIPPEVPPEFTEDYREACLILAESPKASAALSRRCLQLILHEKAGVNENNLKREIDKVISIGTLPSEIADSLHNLREIGNFAAHPQQHQVTGEIVPVEPGEAEWCLEVIEMLYDFYFVRPADIEKRREAWEQKRIAAQGR